MMRTTDDPAIATTTYRDSRQECRSTRLLSGHPWRLAARLRAFMCASVAVERVYLKVDQQEQEIQNHG